MEIKKIKKLTPRFNYVLTTADCSEKKRSGIYLPGTSAGGSTGAAISLDKYQKVVAVGEFISAREHNKLKEGCVVEIDLTQFAKHKYEDGEIKGSIQNMNTVVEYDIPTIQIDGVTHLYLPDNAIKAIIDEYE